MNLSSSRHSSYTAAHKKQMPFVAGRGAWPSALSSPRVFRVHRSEAAPEAIRQAKPKGGRKRKDGTRSPGSAALLHLIARVAMRDVRLDKPPKK